MNYSEGFRSERDFDPTAADDEVGLIGHCGVFGRAEEGYAGARTPLHPEAPEHTRKGALARCHERQALTEQDGVDGSVSGSLDPQHADIDTGEECILWRECGGVGELDFAALLEILDGAAFGRPVCGVNFFGCSRRTCPRRNADGAKALACSPSIVAASRRRSAPGLHSCCCSSRSRSPDPRAAGCC